MSKGTVLVTGFSGFLGSAVALQLLEAGYKVRGAVRSESKARPWLKKYPQYSSQLEFTYVPDIAAPGAFDKAIQGVDYVIHTASPLADKCVDPERDMLLPAINGTLSVLKSADRPGSTVKRVVITSSFGAMEDYGQPWSPEHLYTEADWCPISYERAKAEKEDQALIYVVAKKEAEQAAFKYMKDNKTSFDFVSVLPTTIIGPTVQPVEKLGDLPLSCTRIGDFFDTKELPSAPVAPPIVDVADVALCHVRALEIPEAAGQRYLCGVHGHTPAQVANILRRAFPSEAHRIPEGNDEPWSKDFRWDGSKASRELHIEWTPKEISYAEAGRQWLELEKATRALA